VASKGDYMSLKHAGFIVTDGILKVAYLFLNPGNLQSWLWPQ
jgi:hypothetical protein